MCWLRCAGACCAAGSGAWPGSTWAAPPRRRSPPAGLRRSCLGAPGSCSAQLPIWAPLRWLRCVSHLDITFAGHNERSDCPRRNDSAPGVLDTPLNAASKPGRSMHCINLRLRRCQIGHCQALRLYPAGVLLETSHTLLMGSSLTGLMNAAGADMPGAPG